MFKNYTDWAISIEVPKRETINDYVVMSVTTVELQAIGGSKRKDYLLSARMRKGKYFF